MTIAIAITTRARAVSSCKPTGSPSTRALLNTPMMGIKSVPIDARVVGNRLMTLNHAHWQKITGPRIIKVMANVDSQESLEMVVMGSKIKAPMMIGMPPRMSCQPARRAVGIFQSKYLVETVPAAQRMDATNIKTAPAEANPRVLMSGPMRIVSPAIPSPSPTRRPVVNRSLSMKLLRIAAHTGMVKAMMDPRPAFI